MEKLAHNTDLSAFLSKSFCQKLQSMCSKNYSHVNAAVGTAANNPNNRITK